MRAFAGELVGTFIMVLIGIGSVAVAALTDLLPSLWQVALIWGAGVAVAIYGTASLSGAHLNPAVSLTFAAFRPERLAWGRLPLYWAAQLCGALVAGLAGLVLFERPLRQFELREGLVRGAAGSERAAMMFGQYFPNPAMFGTGAEAMEIISPLGAVLVEAFGTSLLMIVILLLTDAAFESAPWKPLVPLFIGLTVSALIVAFAPLTQGGWNPARDFGPRVVAALAGFGDIALPGPRAGFWVYIVGPLAGALAGGLLYDRIIRPCIAAASSRGRGRPEMSSIADPALNGVRHE